MTAEDELSEKENCQRRMERVLSERTESRVAGEVSMAARSSSKTQMVLDGQVRELREQLHGRDVQISTLKQHLALLTSDFKYNLKLLEDRDFELDQCDAQLTQSESAKTLKVKEMELLVAEIANLRGHADRDATHVQELESTLSQYKESVRSVRERLEEALTLRDQELTCHRSELEDLQTKLCQQTESVKVQEKDFGDAVKACERTWSQRYSECHKTVLTLVAEQDALLKLKLDRDKELESIQVQVLGLQKALDEVTQVSDSRRKECATLSDQLMTAQEQMSSRVGLLEQEKHELEVNLRKRILEEYDGKIAELLAQLQSIEYAVSLERRESHTRSITTEAQHAEQISTLHQTLHDVRRERDVLLDKVAKLEKEISTLKGSLAQVRTHETRLSEREAGLTKDLTSLQDSLHEAQTLLEKSEVEKTHEISLLHGFLHEARAKEHLFAKKEGEHIKRMNSLEKALDEARSKLDKLSRRDSEQTKELIAVQDVLTEAKNQKDGFSKKNAEYVKEKAVLMKSLHEAQNQAEMFSKQYADSKAELANLQQSLSEARNRGDMVEQKNDEHTKDIADLKRVLHEARTQDELLRRTLEAQSKETADMQESLYAAKAEGELLLKAEAAHAEEICVLHRSLAETQRQADAARSHAKHLDEILKVTQTEARRRVEIKESVSCLVTGAQDVQELDTGQESTTIECSPNRFPDMSSDAVDQGRIGSWKQRLPSKGIGGLECGFIGGEHQDMGYEIGTSFQAIAESEEEPQANLEEENRFLKARVEELHAENFKVGVVLSDLRHELETVGILHRPEEHAAALPTKSSEQDTIANHVLQGPCMSNLVGKTRAKPLMIPQQINRPPVVLLPQQEAISLAEKDELQMLRAEMKILHHKNALFYKQQAESMNVPQETTQHRSFRENEICPSHAASHGVEFHEDPSKSYLQSPNRHSSTSFEKTGISQMVAVSGLQEEASFENQSALTVSTEVLKLNEQIARVRQQLTSLCSKAHTNPTSPRSVEKRRSQTRLQFDIPPCPGLPAPVEDIEALTNQKFGPSGYEGSVQRAINSSHFRRPVKEERVLPLSARGRGILQPRQKSSLNWADMGDVLIGKSSPQQDFSGDAQLTQENAVSLTQQKLAPRLSARDSLESTRKRPTVPKKSKVRVPSVASSHSNFMCMHCQRCMTDDEVEGLQHSTPELSYNQSRDLCCDHSHWQDSRQPRIDSSTGSERRGPMTKSLHNRASGHWSGDSDESNPSRSMVRASRLDSHVAQKHHSSKMRDITGAPRGEKVERRAHPEKDNVQVRRPASILQKKRAGTEVVSKFTRKEKAFPANLRADMHSHHHEVNHFRVSTNLGSKTSL